MDAKNLAQLKKLIKVRKVLLFLFVVVVAMSCVYCFTLNLKTEYNFKFFFNGAFSSTHMDKALTIRIDFMSSFCDIHLIPFFY